MNAEERRALVKKIPVVQSILEKGQHCSTIHHSMPKSVEGLSAVNVVEFNSDIFEQTIPFGEVVVFATNEKSLFGTVDQQESVGDFISRMLSQVIGENLELVYNEMRLIFHLKTVAGDPSQFSLVLMIMPEAALRDYLEGRKRAAGKAFDKLL